ncbi:Arc family DNA-binding protein [Pseudomonas fluorescens]|uniref:Arc family DNA-binding protein n=1 Tax=Pseudomonas fluorescens TaxID=294 RepID=UPI000A659A38|nr:Arc family DNA-binding protein [Pseudomonas fluorescens]
MTDRHQISPYPIRMPAELRDQLEESARKGSRSLHAEIISRLTASFSPRTLDDVHTAKAAELDGEIARLSMESTKYSRALEALMSKAKAAASTEDEDSFGPQILEVAEALGRTEREKFQAMMRREMLE